MNPGISKIIEYLLRFFTVEKNTTSGFARAALSPSVMQKNDS